MGFYCVVFTLSGNNIVTPWVKTKNKNHEIKDIVCDHRYFIFWNHSHYSHPRLSTHVSIINLFSLNSVTSLYTYFTVSKLGYSSYPKYILWTFKSDPISIFKSLQYLPIKLTVKCAMQYMAGPSLVPWRFAHHSQMYTKASLQLHFSTVSLFVAQTFHFLPPYLFKPFFSPFLRW